MDARIIIVDDREARQQEDLGKDHKEDLYKTLLSFSNVKMVKECSSVEDLKSYDVIFFHRSYAIQKNLLQDLITLLDLSKDKYLILFSGGITEQRIDMNAHYLSLNSKDLYSQRLIDFLEDLKSSNSIILFKLLYGKSWKLPILLRYRQLMWQGTDSLKENVTDWIENMEEMFSSEIEKGDEAIDESLKLL